MSKPYQNLINLAIVLITRVVDATHISMEISIYRQKYEVILYEILGTQSQKAVSAYL